MTTRNGTAARIVAFVAAHPGCTRAQMIEACRLRDQHAAMPTYCVKAGMIFSAGPRGSQRYYPTAEQAAAMHDRLVADAARRRREARERSWRLRNLRMRARRHAAGSKPLNTRPGHHVIELPPGVTLSPTVRITVAPTPWKQPQR